MLAFRCARAAVLSLLSASLSTAACGGDSHDVEADACVTTGDAFTGPYSAGYVSPEPEEVEETGALPEHRLNHGVHPFLAWIEPERRVALRPHPGDDDLDWGTTVHLSPFLSGAEPGGVTSQCVRVLKDAVEITASGGIPAPDGGTAGTFELSLKLSYDPQTRRVSSTEGRYVIDLASPPALDLNLLRLTSTRHLCVPLASGGCGNTGDLRRVELRRDGAASEPWIPEEEPLHLPDEVARLLRIEAVGGTNELLDCQSDSPSCSASPAGTCSVESLGACEPPAAGSPCKPTVAVEVELLDAPDGVSISAEGRLDTPRPPGSTTDNVAVTARIPAGTPVQHVELAVVLSASAPCQ